MRRMDLAKFGVATLITAGVALAAAPCGFAQTQDAQPSVADAARAAAAKKDKDKSANTAATKTVITEDSLGSGAAVTPKSAGANAAGGATSGSNAAGNGGGAMNSASLDEAWARLQATEATLNQFEPLGKAEVGATVLGGYTGDFPGRAEWEEKMYAEKMAYVARSRQLIQAMKETLLQMAQMNSGDQKMSPNDPKVMALTKRTTQLMQMAAKTEGEFQGVVSEGRALAKQGLKQ
jgi:hypothetical protein